MKKTLVLLTTLLFASVVLAENEAIYDTETGSVEIPLLSIKGQEETISVTLQQQDKELVFAVVDSAPEEVVKTINNGKESLSLS